MATSVLDTQHFVSAILNLWDWRQDSQNQVSSRLKLTLTFQVLTLSAANQRNMPCMCAVGGGGGGGGSGYIRPGHSALCQCNSELMGLAPGFTKSPVSSRLKLTLTFQVGEMKLKHHQGIQ